MRSGRRRCWRFITNWVSLIQHSFRISCISIDPVINCLLWSSARQVIDLPCSLFSTGGGSITIYKSPVDALVTCLNWLPKNWIAQHFRWFGGITLLFVVAKQEDKEMFANHLPVFGWYCLMKLLSFASHFEGTLWWYNCCRGWQMYWEFISALLGECNFWRKSSYYWVNWLAGGQFAASTWLKGKQTEDTSATITTGTYLLPEPNWTGRGVLKMPRSSDF